MKILRPGIEAAFDRDLELFYWLADIAETRQPKLRRLRPREVVRLFEQTVRIEMDLRMEAAAASELDAPTSPTTRQLPGPGGRLGRARPGAS